MRNHVPPGLTRVQRVLIAAAVLQVLQAAAAVLHLAGAW